MDQLLSRIQFEKDEAAFEGLYRGQAFRLFQFAFAFVRNKETAEEIVNDVFLKLWQHRTPIDQLKHLSGYRYVAVKTTASNYLRKKIDTDALTVDLFYLSPDPEAMLVTGELRKKIAGAIDQLPPRCKLIFKLVKEDGLSATEVAEILDISYKTVTTQLTIALKKLEELL